MSGVLLVGAGAVGSRTARQLVETEGVEDLLIADRDMARARNVAASVGRPARATEWDPRRSLPPGVAAVVVAADVSAERGAAERALEARVPIACISDDPDGVRRLFDLDDAAREAGVAVAVGCGLAPGLSDVLARHAADALEVVTEVHVARAGAGGEGCAGARERSRRGVALEWRDGAWVRERAGSGRRLVWFPGPVGGLDCRRVGSGQATLLVEAFPLLARASMRMADGHRQGSTVRRLGGTRRREPDGGWGAVWVEVRGRRGRTEEVLVYGAVDRIVFAAGAVLAVAAAWMAGLGGGSATQTGAHGLGALVEPVPFLAELARRGVKAAVFEGAAGG